MKIVLNGGREIDDAVGITEEGIFGAPELSGPEMVSLAEQMIERWEGVLEEHAEDIRHHLIINDPWHCPICGGKLLAVTGAFDLNLHCMDHDKAPEAHKEWPQWWSDEFKAAMLDGEVTSTPLEGGGTA